MQRSANPLPECVVYGMVRTSTGEHSLLRPRRKYGMAVTGSDCGQRSVGLSKTLDRAEWFASQLDPPKNCSRACGTLNLVPSLMTIHSLTTIMADFPQQNIMKTNEDLCRRTSFSIELYTAKTLRTYGRLSVQYTVERNRTIVPILMLP